MKRNPRKVKWTKAYRKLHGKELTQDATFEFERRRNRPERYNREVVEQTLKAMKKIDEVRVQRESKFWESRCVLSSKLRIVFFLWNSIVKHASWKSLIYRVFAWILLVATSDLSVTALGRDFGYCQ